MQGQIGLADARLRAARLFLMTPLDEIWASVVASGAPPTLEQRLTLRLATTHVIREAKDVVAMIYEYAGSSAIFEKGPFAVVAAPAAAFSCRQGPSEGL